MRRPNPALAAGLAATMLLSGIPAESVSAYGYPPGTHGCHGLEAQFAVATDLVVDVNSGWELVATYHCAGDTTESAGSAAIVETSGVPASASAVLANLTMVGGTTSGYITADSCSSVRYKSQTKSNGNHVVSDAIANLSVVALDVGRTFCIYNSAPVHLVADVQGYFAPPATGGQLFAATTPKRLLDTRTAPLSRPPAGSITRIVTGAAAGTTAVLANLTMTGGVTAGYITADKCSTLFAGPQTKSNGNFSIDSSIANLSVVPVDADGSFCIYNEQPVHLIVDLQGSFAPSMPGGLKFTLAPYSADVRKLDTRGPDSSRPSAGSITRVVTGVAAGTSAVIVNLTMTGAPAGGYITADRCSALIAGPQTKSNGNHQAVTPIANLSVVPVDADGSFCIYNEEPVDLIVDLLGSFSATGTQQFFPTTPTRALDTRSD